jgi:arginyl-tRNA--protein-N-Asp/Glu arginylyltransferase
MIGLNRALSPMTSEPAAASPPFGTLLDETPHDCPYLPGRTAVLPARWYDKALDGDQVDALLAQADRRVGRTLYRPSCPSCQECKALRVPVMDFTPTRSQRRVMKQNEDIEVLAGPPQSTPERLALFNKHKLQRGLGEALSTLAHYRSWLVTSCMQTIETCYVLKGEVIGVGILDLGRLDASSVYFYFDPAHADRSLGTFSALAEMAWMRAQGRRYYYLGLYVAACDHLNYKARFFPHERLVDGAWRRFEAPASSR